MTIYIDHLGNESTYDGMGELAWRISIYPVVIRDQALLMVKPAWANRLELPGGAVELHGQETLLEGAIRECREETGYTFAPRAESLVLAGESFFHYRSLNRYCHSLLFTVSGTVDDGPDPTFTQSPHEIREVRWEPLSSLSEQSVYAPHWTMLRTCGLV